MRLVGIKSPSLPGTLARPFMVKIILMIGAIVMLSSSSATAQRTLAGAPCAPDLKKLCAGIQPGNDRLRACMRENLGDVSRACLVRLAKFAEVRGFREDCGAHIRQQCASVERGGGQLGDCLRPAVASLSDSCKNALARAVPWARDGERRRR